MFRSRLSRLLILALGMFAGGLVVFWHAHPVLAQVDTQALATFGDQAGLATQTDLRVIIARIIRVFLGFLGIVLLGFILYGGFVWMTAGGNPERIKTAKRIFVNAAIGLVIVLSSFAISQFILTTLLGVTEGGNGNGGAEEGYDDGSFGSGTVFTLNSINTACAASVRNFEIQLAFSQPVSEASVINGGIAVSDANNVPVPGTYSVEGKNVYFSPEASCGVDAPNATCFESGANYTVLANAAILKSTRNTDLVCSIAHPCEFSFVSGTAIDLEPPSVDLSTPEEGASIVTASIELLQAHVLDDVGGSSVEFLVDTRPVFTSGLSLSSALTVSPDNHFSTDTTEWDTAGTSGGRTYQLAAEGRDCAGNVTRSPNVSVVVREAHCGNGVADTDLGETGVDCGGDASTTAYCGACEGGTCETTADCASGNMCTNGQCVGVTEITAVSPGDGAEGNLITISGSGFGDTPGTIRFLGGATTSASAYVCDGVTTWSDDEVIIAVPSGTVDGAVEIIAADGKTDATNDATGPFIRNFDVNDVVRPGLCAVTPDPLLPQGEMSVKGVGFGQSRGTSTIYLGSFPVSAYLDWTDTLLEAVAPNARAGAYPVQVFSGNYVCANPSGVLGAFCKTDADCNAETQETCRTSACSEDLSRLCTVNADCGTDGGVCVSLRQGSNPVRVAMTGITENNPPKIFSVDTGWHACSDGTVCVPGTDCVDGSVCSAAPNWGPIDQYVTIFGTGFGTSLGTVYFTNTAGGADDAMQAIGSTDVPNACEDVLWKDDSITVKVPTFYLSGRGVSAGSHAITVIRGEDGLASNTTPFEIVTGSPGPSLCAIEPSVAPAEVAATVFGEGFGEEVGVSGVIFSSNLTAAVTSWLREEIGVIVPSDTVSGPVFVANRIGTRSNPVMFTVGDCRENQDLCVEGTACCADGSCRASCEDLTPKVSHYAWRFSTGVIPAAPRVLAYCGDVDGDGNKDGASPSPWNGWSADGVCLNAAVSATFSLPMDPASLTEDTLRVERCENADCDEVTAIPAGNIDVSATTFLWSPETSFEAGKTYRATIKGGAGPVAARSTAGEPLPKDYSWMFNVASDGETCTIGSVFVSPTEHTETILDARIGYLAAPMAANDECVTLACSGAAWDWSSSDNGAVLDTSRVTNACTNTVTAAQETAFGIPARIRAIADVQGNPSDAGLLTVDFTDPEIIEVVPNCDEACVNANILVTFNTAIAETTLTPENVRLYRCANATCNNDGASGLVQIPLVAGNLSYVYVPGTATSTLEINPPQNFSASTNYRLIVDGDVTSTSGVPLSRAQSDCTETGEHCQFKTKSDSAPCAIERIATNPSEFVASYVGQYIPFYATAFGAADSCAPSGQPLDPTDYTWSTWTATDTPNNNTSSVVATMLPAGNPGALARASVLPNGCSNSCVNVGAPASTAQGLCGNGTKEVGEDCDDQNTLSGDGCSSVCLREGGAGTYGNCGNGIVERNVTTGAGEDCDGGVACTSSCTNRGTAALGGTAVCGDGVLDYSSTTGGEDCDDGNTRNFDGCSSQCVNEGTIVQTSAFAVCGNGVVSAGEDCDDGNLAQGDGCSNVCLREGGGVNVFVCGNGGAPERTASGAGEDCDDGNTKNGDGCSSRCINEGASMSYISAPSVCGDGLLGLGEECEAGPGASYAVGPFGIARIDLSAPAEVDADTGYAISTVTAEADGVQGDGTLALSCSCNTDASCGDASALGCGSGSCCFERPTLGTVYPPIGSVNQCRNSAIWVTFSQSMDVDSFRGKEGENPNMYLQLVAINGAAVTPATCPASYKRLSDSGLSSQGFFGRAWEWMKFATASVFGSEANAVTNIAGTCVTPVSYEVEDAGGGTQRARLMLSDLLVANAVYALFVQADGNTSDAERVGVLSANGVSLEGNLLTPTVFTTGTDACLLDDVSAQDLGRVESLTNPLEAASVGFFTRETETHRAQAAGQSVQNGQPQEIAPIPGVYDWSWSWGSNKADAEEGNIITATALVSDAQESDVVAAGESGKETAIAIATITANTISPETPVASTVSGSVNVEALLCERTWPDLSSYPYIEDQTNFSFSYCRDAGARGPEGDLPTLRVVEVPSPSTGILSEFLYEFEGISDALGVRVISNPSYLPPDLWYRAQGFTGNASETTVDGYPAVRDGNTLYVLAANHAGDLYPNIYVISYNANASKEAQQAFDEILTTFQFNANTDEVTDVNVCKLPSGYVTDENDILTACSSDNDCSSGAVCDAEKEQLRRDIVRLSDLARMKRLMETYGSSHGTCSVSGASCETDAQCPGTETCESTVPTIDAGSFYRGTSVSAWPSWSATLGNALQGALPVDPLNTFAPCEVGADPNTCWNAASSQFSCPVGSHVYSYQSVGGRAFRAYAQLEYDAAPWAYAIDASSTDGAELYAEYADYQGPGRTATNDLARGFSSDPLFCDGTARGDSSACGDGVVGAGEACEPGMSFTQACTVGSVQGFQTYTCTSDCRNNPSAVGALLSACTPFSCGNGVVEPLNGETCDDGSVLNGTYGHCSDSCGVSTFSCGDGYLAGNEQCDCGSTANFSSIQSDRDSWSYLNGCTAANGQYTTGTRTSCAYDCTAPGPSCGDGEVTFTEECDGGYETWEGALCSDGTSCRTNADCNGGTCGAGGSACGSSKICLGGTDAGETCSSSSSCNGGTCSDVPYPLARNRTCKAPGSTDACEWNSWSSCVGGGQFCGNGKVEGGELCDDGNGSNSDACTNQCVPNVCGDNFVNVGVESCDAGPQNGAACTAPYGGTCSACSPTCQYLTSTGSFCGDGVINQGETCDGAAMNYACFDNSGNGRAIGDPASCSPSMVGTQGSCATGFTCQKVGACNGGDFNGQSCTKSSGTDWSTQASSDTASCGATGEGTCVFPVCAANCGSMCPTPGSDAGKEVVSVLVQTEEAGAIPREEIGLFSYLSGFTPDNAALLIPACSVGTKITADISMEDVVPPSIDIVFVTDLSGSMGYYVTDGQRSPSGSLNAPIGERRIDYVMDSAADAVNYLFDSYSGSNSEMRIALVSFRGPGSLPQYNDLIELDQDFTSDRNLLISKIRQYGTLLGGKTPTASGINEGIQRFQSSTAGQKVVILLTDGEPTIRLDGSSCASSVSSCVLEAFDLVYNVRNSVQVYSAAIATSPSLIGYAAHMSSNECGLNWSSASDCEPRNFINYAYQADEASEISVMYESVIASLLSANVAFTTDVQGTATVTTGTVRDGARAPLPFPLGFACTGTSTSLPLNVSFSGTGEMNLSNFTFSYCPAR